jgi:hypothetical protein
MGDQPVKLEAEDWEGTWLQAEGAIVAKVVDSEKGILKVAGIESEDTELKFESVDAYLRTWGDWTFASIKEKPESDNDLYLWGRITKSDRQVIIWDPNVEKFKKLVEAGKLPGKVDGDNVILDELKPEHMQIITSGAEGVLFDWENPSALIRVAK